MVLLVGQMLFVGGYFFLAGKFVPRLQPDTESYVSSPLRPLRAMLGSSRSPGYPLILASVRQFSHSFAALPPIHFAAYCAAVLVFYFGLRTHSRGPWMVSLSAGSLLLGSLLQNYVQDVLSDTVAASLAILTVGLTLIAVGRRCPWWLLGLVGAAASATWLTRPAYLFLIALVPILGVLLTTRGAKRQSGAAAPISWPRALGLLSMAVLLPLVAWCALRWCVLGRADVTSTSGSWLIGYAGQFLDSPLVDDLPEDVRPFAVAALERRAHLPPGTLVMTDAPRLSYTRIDRNFAATMNYFLAAVRDVRKQADNLQVEADVRRLAVEILKRRPLWYAICLGKGAVFGLSRAIVDALLAPLSLGLLLLTLLATLAATLSRRKLPDVAAAKDRADTVGLIFLLATLYFVLAILNVVVATPPADRMADAAAIFLPTVMMTVLVERTGLLLAGYGRAASGSKKVRPAA